MVTCAAAAGAGKYLGHIFENSVLAAVDSSLGNTLSIPI
jgi:hypothetical protein